MKVLRLLLVLTFCFSLTGCAALQKALPTIVQLVEDAALAVDQIDGFQRSYFKAHPDATREAQVAEAIGRTRNALIAAERAADGSEATARGESEKAVAAFREAYEHLLLAVSGIPGLKVAKQGDTAASAGSGVLVVPEPLLLAPPGS